MVDSGEFCDDYTYKFVNKFSGEKITLFSNESDPVAVLKMYGGNPDIWKLCAVYKYELRKI